MMKEFNMAVSNPELVQVRKVLLVITTRRTNPRKRTRCLLSESFNFMFKTIAPPRSSDKNENTNEIELAMSGG
jgi:hypothetical protein